MSRIGFEWFFNFFQPFLLASMLYLFAFLVAGVGMLGYERTLNRTAFAMIALTFGLHMFAADRSDDYFRTSAGDESVFDRRFHRLGDRAVGADLRADLSAGRRQYPGVGLRIHDAVDRALPRRRR